MGRVETKLRYVGYDRYSDSWKAVVYKLREDDGLAVEVRIPAWDIVGGEREALEIAEWHERREWAA